MAAKTDGLDLIISSMESIDKIASEEAKKGTPIYIVQSDSLEDDDEGC